MINIIICINDTHYINGIKKILSFIGEDIEFNNLEKKPDLMVISTAIGMIHVNLIKKYLNPRNSKVPYIIWSKEIHFRKTLKRHPPICFINHASTKEGLINYRDKWNDHVRFPIGKDDIHFNVPLSLFRPNKVDIYNINQSKSFKNRKYNCILIARHTSSGIREALFNALSKKIDKVIGFGKWKGGLERPKGSWGSLDEYYSNTYFTIVTESTCLHEGGSEKLMNALRGGAIPIYCEYKNDFKRDTIDKYFNKNRIINVNDFENYDELAEYVANLLKDKERLYKMMNEPILAQPVHEKLRLFDEKPSDYYINMGKFIRSKLNI